MTDNPVQALIEALKSTRVDVRRTSAEACFKRANSGISVAFSAGPALEAAVDDDDDTVRRAAALALLRSDSCQALVRAWPALVELFAGEEEVDQLDTLCSAGKLVRTDSTASMQLLSLCWSGN